VANVDTHCLSWLSDNGGCYEGLSDFATEVENHPRSSGLPRTRDIGLARAHVTKRAKITKTLYAPDGGDKQARLADAIMQRVFPKGSCLGWSLRG
jgi:hypothetical protein